MRVIEANGVALHFADQGDPDKPAAVFSNSLGTDFRLWDRVADRLAGRLRMVRYDSRGHGLSGCPAGAYSVADLANDAAALMDALGLEDALFVGISIGGLVAQQLALARPDLVRAAVLSNTGSKIGSRELWNQRISAIRDGGIDAIADPIIERWLSASFRRDNKVETEAWRAMLVRTPAAGYVSSCEALRDADLTERASGIDLPALAVVGSEDGATPPRTGKRDSIADQRRSLRTDQRRRPPSMRGSAGSLRRSGRRVCSRSRNSLSRTFRREAQYFVQTRMIGILPTGLDLKFVSRLSERAVVIYLCCDGPYIQHMQEPSHN